jgi:hypothetical protein
MRNYSHLSALLIAATTVLSLPDDYQQKPSARNLDSTPYRQLQPCNLQGVQEELWCGKLSVFENRQGSLWPVGQSECRSITGPGSKLKRGAVIRSCRRPRRRSPRVQRVCMPQHYEGTVVTEMLC